jgi:cytochrome c553
MKNKLFTLLAGLFATLCVCTPSQGQDLKGNGADGAKKVAMCIGCHGLPQYQASFPEVYKVPKIAGQNEKYIVAALNGYRAGDRKHPSMRAIAGSMSDQDIADAAAYYTALSDGEPAPAVPADPASPPPQALQAKLAVCVACHGKNFNNAPDPANPRLAGQYADYLYAALKAYATDGNPHIGRASATMRGMVMQEAEGKKKAMFTLGEMKQVAAYLASLPGELRTVPQSRFHQSH